MTVQELKDAMNTIRICSVCGNPLPPDAPAGLCPVCLLKTDARANPPAKTNSGEPATTISISPEAFWRCGSKVPGNESRCYSCSSC
jgi:predicted amidophosphoribosyltransferase